MKKLSLYFLLFVIPLTVFAQVPRLTHPSTLASPPPLEYFAKLPRFSKPKISPDGKRVAATIPVKGKSLVVIQKIITSGDNTKEEIVPFSAGGLHVNWYEWVNSDRLLFSLRGARFHAGELINLTRLVSSDRTNKNSLGLKMEQNKQGLYRQHVHIISFLDNDPKHVLAALDDNPYRWAAPMVHKVNVYSGTKHRIEKNKLGVYRWIADNNGVLRVGVKHDTKSDHNEVTIYYRENAEAKWEELQNTHYFARQRLVPVRFHETDANILLISNEQLAKETDKHDVDLLQYDLAQRKIIGPYIDDREKAILKIVQRALDKREVELVSYDKSKNIFIYLTFSDTVPPEYYIFDLPRKSLVHLASEYPELEKVKLAPMEKLSYSARDGLTIPAFLTRPLTEQKKNLPLVVMPHGGPSSHDKWGFDNYVQFLASRGYAVFQPQFRGSTNYGLAHEAAGYKQWGLAIQDDITDGVNYLISKGIADPKRICIVGSSFGGYAAAMGLVKTPRLFQCGISINGVLDQKKYKSSIHRLLFANINQVMLNDYNDLEKTSPCHMAENIRAPLLLISAEKDTVVPVSHSRSMYKKLKKLNKAVEYIELLDGEHWRTNESHELIKFEAIEKFLKKHISTVPLQ